MQTADKDNPPVRAAVRHTDLHGTKTTMSVYEATFRRIVSWGATIAAHVRLFDYDTDTMLLREGAVLVPGGTVAQAPVLVGRLLPRPEDDQRRRGLDTA